MANAPPESRRAVVRTLGYVVNYVGRYLSGTAMRRAIRRLAIFIWDNNIDLLCCAAFRTFFSPGRHERRFQHNCQQDHNQLANARRLSSASAA